MDIYIDKENLLSLINSRTETLYYDCIKILKKQLNIFFNFSKDVLKEDDKLMAWYSSLQEGVGENNKFSFGHNFPSRPLKSNAYKQFNSQQLSSVYLLNDEKIEILKSTGTVLIGKPGEELSILNSLFLNQKDYLFDKRWKIGGNGFEKWEDLIDYSLPLTDIIIVDPFVCSDTSLLKYNLLPFLSCLSNKVKTKLNVIIYTNKETSLPYEDLSYIIRKTINDSTGVNPNFTLIKYTDKRGVPSKAEHDRTVFLNYVRIYSGDTINYFNNTGKITKGREIHYSSLARDENYYLAFELIKDLQENINFLNKNGTVEGDKVSGYLTF